MNDELVENRTPPACTDSHMLVQAQICACFDAEGTVLRVRAETRHVFTPDTRVYILHCLDEDAFASCRLTPKAVLRVKFDFCIVQNVLKSALIAPPTEPDSVRASA